MGSWRRVAIALFSGLLGAILLSTGLPGAAEMPSAPAPAPETAPTWDSLFKGLTPEEEARSRLLLQGDQLYSRGDTAAAEALYRQAKEPWDIREPESLTPVDDAAELSPAGSVYWREAQAGLARNSPAQTQVALELLVAEHPEFLPGQRLYIQQLLAAERLDEAATALEVALSRYPYHPLLLQTQTEVLMAQQRWLEAAITARQFAIFNPGHPEAEAMQALALANMDRFRGETRERLTGNFLSNLLTGAASYLLTGGLFGPFTALNSGMILLQGEVAIGERVAAQALSQLPIVEDEAINEYVRELGYGLAPLAGRDEFEYDFYVVRDDSLNAFALPGGKIFVHLGAIMATHSEAELAGLLGHEIAHAALSHGFQLVTQGNLTSSLAALIPVPEVAGLAANLAVSGYSRSMERQADVLGTQILAAREYAADGLYSLMQTLEAENQRGASWFSSHPAPSQRVDYLQQLVQQGFNRYAYEGVATHLAMRQRARQLWGNYQAEENAA